MLLRIASLSLFLVPVTAALASAQGNEGYHHAAAPEIRALRIDQAIILDGLLDESAWATAPPATEFTQLDPEEGRPASERTEVRILYDDVALYVGARFHDRQPVSTRLGRRDAFLEGSDWFSVTFDSRHDHVTGTTFRVNPSGVRGDNIGGGLFGDPSWDPVWDVATAVSDSGWSVEMRIPFSQLRFSGADEQTWGIQLGREINRRQERAFFAFTPKKERGGPPRWGHLVGLRGIEPGRRLEILPYVVARASYLNVQADDPFRERGDRDLSAGVDLKYRVTSALTLDATINPDFGQVEQDPAVVNLTVFETFFDEKRPFFVEGAEIFRFGRFGTDLFHSRRIGRQPQGSLPAGTRFADLPESSTIVGAAKLTGKTAGGWSVGVLEAVAQREEARFVDLEGVTGRHPVEPLTNYFVGRVRRDLRTGQSIVGLMGTAVHRDLDDESLSVRLRSSAYALGTDFGHEWANRSWALRGTAAFSRIAGEPGVILAAQTSSARYYQRPDADHLDVDSTASSMSGYAVALGLERQAGLHWRGGVSVDATSPGFEINDLGFQFVADRIGTNGFVSYQETKPGRVFRFWEAHAGVGSTWNYGGDRLSTYAGSGFNATLLNYWGFGGELNHNFESLADRLTRGGPLTADPAGWRSFFNVRSDSRKPVTVSAFGFLRWSEAGDRGGSISTRIGLKAGERLSLSVGPRWESGNSVAQYVTTIPDSLATGTFGRRYVFADLEGTTVSFDTRMTYVFTPGLTLELYAQPFVSANEFGRPKELRAPRTFDFDVYGEDVGTVTGLGSEAFQVDPDGAGPAAPFTVADSDFNVRSLRGNAVLRWEWRPGSTLFLVWQQRRAGFEPFGDFDFGRDVGGILDPKPENIFLVKINYWLNP